MARQPYPGKYDIKLSQGISRRILFRWQIRSSDPATPDEIFGAYNLSEYEILFQVRRNVSDITPILEHHPEASPVLEIVDAVEGAFALNFSAFLTSDLPTFKGGRYDILMRSRNDEGRNVHFMTGAFEVEEIAVKLP